MMLLSRMGRVNLDRTPLTGGDWKTLENGEHVYIKDGSIVAGAEGSLDDKAIASAHKTSDLFGLPRSKVEFYKEEGKDTYGEHGGDTVHIVNNHLGRSIDKSLNLKLNRSITQGEHIAAHEVSHRAYSEDSELGQKAMERLKNVKAGEYKSPSVSIYGAFGGPHENLMELGAVYSHSPKALKAYSPEMYSIAKDWFDGVKKGIKSKGG